MSAQAHTPGPWRVEYSTRNGAALRIEADDDRPGGLGSVVRQNGIGMPACDVGKANARLIAAAPDLLAACKNALSEMNARIDFATANREPVPVFIGIADLHAAIAKAEARS